MSQIPSFHLNLSDVVSGADIQTDRPRYLRPSGFRQAGYRLPQVLPPPPLLCDSSPETFPTVSSRGRCEMDNERRADPA